MWTGTLTCMKWDKNVGETIFAERRFDRKHRFNVCRQTAKVATFRARRTEV